MKSQQKTPTSGPRSGPRGNAKALRKASQKLKMSVVNNAIFLHFGAQNNMAWQSDVSSSVVSSLLSLTARSCSQHVTRSVWPQSLA